MNDFTPTVPLMDKPFSLMEVGPNGDNLAAASAARHPVDEMQRATRTQDLDFVRHVYGSGLAMRLATEEKFAMQEQRASMRRSAGIYGDIVSGRDTKLDFCDMMSRPRPGVAKPNPHVVMERQLGM
jgi:hypothetical protein